MRARILFDDPSGRFKVGDVGPVVSTCEDPTEYEYRVYLGTIRLADPPPFLPEVFDRIYSFRPDEVELFDD